MRSTLWQWFNNTRAIVLAVLVHVVVLVILIVNFEWDVDRPKSISSAKVIEANAVDPKLIKQELDRIKKAELEKKQAIEREQKKIEEEKKRLAEKEKKRKELAKKKAAEEKARKEAAAKKKAAEEKAKKLAEKKANEKREREKKLAEQKRQAEIERKRKEKAAQQQRNKELQAALAAEEKATLIEHYEAVINQHVQERWDVPPDNTIKIGMSCLVTVNLLPSGDILSLSLKQSSGNPAYDDAAIKAVRRSEPIPLPPAKENLFDEFRTITIPFVLRNKKT